MLTRAVQCGLGGVGVAKEEEGAGSRAQGRMKEAEEDEGRRAKR